MSASADAALRTLILAVAAAIPAAGTALGIDWLRFNVAPAYMRAPFGFIGAIATLAVYITCAAGATIATAKQCVIDCGGVGHGRTRFP